MCVQEPALLREALRRVAVFVDPAVDREDLEQEIRIVLWEACRTHDPALSSLKTWCRRHVRFAVSNFIQAQFRRKACLSLDAPADREGSRTLGELVACPSRRAEERLADADFVRWLVAEMDLTPLEALALRVHVLGGSYRELEEATGISWKSLDNAWQRVRRKALKLLQEERPT